MTSVTNGGLSFDVHTDVVEAALDAEDFTPLVRVVFDAVASSLSTATTKQALLTRAPQATPAMDLILEDEALTEGGAGAGRRASDRLKAMRREAAAPVVSALERIVEGRSAELSQICRGNAEEIVSSLQELDAMQSGAEELRERMAGSDEALREAGGTFLNGLEQLQELRRLRDSVAASCKAVGAAKQLLQLCAQAGRAVNGNELYRAFRLLERSEREFLGSSSGGEPCEDEEDDGALPGTGGHPRLASGRLRDFLVGRVQEMQAAIQHKAVRDFNAWLVSAREQARGIGTAALRNAAWRRQRDESLAAQRRRLAAELPAVADPESVAPMLARPLPPRSAGPVKLQPASHPAAARLLEAASATPFADELAGIDMVQLHRCLQVHECLGKTAMFQEYYQTNRRGQLNNDLAAQGHFLTQYQSYLAQLVGFFVIENRVGEAAEALSGAQVDAGWEAAITYLKLALETAFATVDSPSTMLAIKDLVLLTTSALGQRGYHVAPLLDMLMNARPRYHELLTVAARPHVRRIVEEARGQKLMVETAREAADLAGELGLPLSSGGDRAGMGPTPPFEAPFSQMVPQLLRSAQGFVDESAAYAWGLVGPAEVLSVVRVERDTMLLTLPLPALDEAFSEPPPAADTAALDGALQNIADLAALADSLQALDDYTHYKVRGVHSKERFSKPGGRSLSETIATAASQPLNEDAVSKASTNEAVAASLRHGPTQTTKYTSGLTAKFTDLQAKAERSLRAALEVQLRAVLSGAPPLDWLPERPVQTAASHSPHVLQLRQFMQARLTPRITGLNATLAKVAARVSRVSYQRIGHILAHLLGQTLLGALLDDSVPAFNLYALFRLNDDVLALAEVASKTDIPSMQVGLQEAIQFCDLFATGRLEDILDGAKRRESYYAVDLRRLLVALRKFREVAPGSSHGLHLRRSRQPASFLKKKQVDKVAKALRMQLEASGATGLPK